MAEFCDLHVFGNLKELESVSSKLGWTRIVKPAEMRSKNVQEEARKLRKEAEVIIASGDDSVNRLASDCWEVDVIGSPEVHDEGDFMHQMNSGIDYVIAKACAEKGIAVEINFANVLGTFGRKRAQLLARMAQNVSICRDCGCDVIITSGAKDKFGLRSPRDLMAFGVVLGMKPDEALKAVSENPAKVLRKTENRKDPNVITKGLEVKGWGSRQKEKRIYGWY